MTILGWDQWLALFGHFLLLSLMAVGGAITTAPDMHRYLVDKNAWMTDAQFNASIALAQAAPGPNVLFVALMGWHVGLNATAAVAGGYPGALLGVAVAMLGIMIPSATLTLSATRWAERNQEMVAVRAFKIGFAPVVIALLLATGWLLGAANQSGAPSQLAHALGVVVAVASAIAVWRTKLHMLWLLGAGALLGALGLI
jgi:chromate transporter